jgi:sulfur carrier protein ThiS
MSYIKNTFTFTPFHTRKFNQTDNNYNYNSNQSNFNNKINSFSNNNFNFNASKIISNNQDISSSNIINNNYYSTNNRTIYDEQNEYNSYYILVNGLDEDLKETFFNFLENQKINPRDVKVINNYKVIIKFEDQKARSDFVENYNNVINDFIGVEIEFMDEEKKNRIINQNANKIAHSNAYYNNYMNDSLNMVQLPKKKSNFQKFIEVFLNL